MPVEYSPSITSARIIPSLLRCPPERGRSAAGVVEMQPLQHRLRVAVRAPGNARGAALLSDLIERQKALAGARMGRARRQPTQIRRRLIPSRMVNTQHDRSE